MRLGYLIKGVSELTKIVERTRETRRNESKFEVEMDKISDREMWSISARNGSSVVSKLLTVSSAKTLIRELECCLAHLDV